MNDERTTTIDELVEEFTSKDFPFVQDVLNEIESLKELQEFDVREWNDIIDVWYHEVFLVSKKSGQRDSMFGYNDIQSHFVFYCLYLLVSNKDKAWEHAKQAHHYYIKNTLSYQWENIVYKAFREIYKEYVVPDCILPNNSRPDLVINPIYDKTKYHSRGTDIIKADKIIDMKTSIYDITKEVKQYKKFCNELVIVYIDDQKKSKDREITYISAEELKQMVSDKKTVDGIKNVQRKIRFDYILHEFEKRFV
ncbi:hypothetical protein PP175_26255 (plasmid) [Aneurinibacillus sp. Ricciae_BoGa-3]|uniref:hypothetical protein n=1 Tax=Aneurinibacillus sp. Ricciae_BoGa-3 TaxID=3022697 RepID=UPI0023400290|nr:hypothetical protein [Aneurinibacillus sp. Ricciae_BoGa-3]WCK57571.1 hypothetical protein PP175_26255 [Aneurinibacillus sp. Ricciae_BoGa-3]